MEFDYLELLETPDQHCFEPIRFAWGEQSLQRLPELIEAEGRSRAMLVCGSNTSANETVMDAVTSALGDTLAHVYPGVESHVPLETVEQGVERKRTHDIDALVSVGGGSAVDTAKAISVLDAEEGRSIHDMKGRTTGENERVMPDLPAEKTPIFPIVTTLSAAEVTNAVGITDTEAGEKVVLADDEIRPTACCYDPRLTATTPSQVLAETSMAALDHAVEIIYSEVHAGNPFYHATAEKSIELLVDNIADAVNEPENLESITNVQLGAAMSGLGTFGGVSLNHGINHTVCARHPVSHGQGNGILLPQGIRFNFEAVPDRIAQIADAMDVDTRGSTDEEMLESLVETIRDLQREIGLPTRLRDVGVERDDFEHIAEIAVTDPEMASNPRPVSADDIVAILERAW